jgi:hypothetical protein
MAENSSDTQFSPHILDLSSRAKNQGNARQNNCFARDLASAKMAEKKRTRLLSIKAIGLLLIIAISSVSTFGMDAWKKIEAIKTTAFSASAMNEENIAALEKLMGIIRYLPATGELKKIKELAGDFESFKNILGFDRPRKYLLVFQNPSEARAAGGFIGSVGILEMQAGKIKSVKLEDVYALDGQLKISVEPPGPIKKISASWSLHDSNWFFNFPDSAEKISWFYEKAGGETVDGVIAFNPKVVQDILKITGPIKIPEYGAELNEKNFVETAQNQVELEYDKTINRPKLFLADFLSNLKGAVESLPLDKKVVIMKGIIANLDEKDIQAVFKSESAEAFIRAHNWDGRVNETDKDYLAVVNSNINGFKTDAVIDQKIDLVTEIAEDGSVINNLTVTRAHNGASGDADWYNKVNGDYLRVYLPRGAELIGAEGITEETPFLKDPSADYDGYFKDELLRQAEKNKTIDGETGVEIFEESGKTVFGSWIYASPGEKVTASWRYRLPFRIEFDANTRRGVYSLLVQKQSGSRTENLSQKIIFPESWKAIGNYPEGFIFKTGKIARDFDMQSDRFAPILFSNEPAKN